MPHAVEGGLGRLIETETRLAEAIAAAEAEAAARLREARAAAEASAAGWRTTLDAEVAELTSRVAAARDAEIGVILRAADERCRGLRELPAGTIAELAGWVEQRVLAPRHHGGPG
jgi:hypothetical protein